MDENEELSKTVNCPNCGNEVQEDLLIPAGETQICPACRDSHIQRLKEGVMGSSDHEYETIRQEHLKHETSLRSVGLLLYLGAALTILGAIMMMTTARELYLESGTDGSGVLASLIIAYAVIGVVLIILARGYRKLRPWIRIPGTIVACLGLLSIPIGTIINGYILYLLWSKKGKVVLSPEYQEVMAATPYIKYRTSPVVWVLLILLAVLLLGGLLSVAFQ